MYTYESHVKPFSEKFHRIKLDDSHYQKANEWAERVAIEKQKESHWQIDNHQGIKRIRTGVLGEIAIEIFLDKDFIDWSIDESKYYHTPDLKSIGFNTGVKTVEYGKFPVIFKSNTYPQIINIIRHDDRTVFLCGVASSDALNNYQSDDLIISPQLRARGTKTGFYGFEHLKYPEDWQF
jgi:hypothetical protein